VVHHVGAAGTQDVNPISSQADQVLGARVDIDRTEDERVVPARLVPRPRTGKPGKPEITEKVIEYDFYVDIDVTHPWVNQMPFAGQSFDHRKLDWSRITAKRSRDAKDIVAALLAMREGAVQATHAETACGLP